MSKNLTYIFLFIFFQGPSVFSWEEIYKKDSVTVYARSSLKGVIPFKAVSEMSVSVEKLYDIMVDWKNKYKWSPKLKYIKLHKTISENNFIFSEYYKTPWPATDREFLLQGKILKRSNNGFSLFAKSLFDDNLADKDHIQADVRVLKFTANKISANKTKVSLEFQGDLKGWMPLWLVNIIQKRWPYKFIKSLEIYALKIDNEEGI